MSCLRTEEPIYMVREQFPLVRYSAQYWMDHAKTCRVRTIDALSCWLFNTKYILCLLLLRLLQ